MSDEPGAAFSALACLKRNSVFMLKETDTRRGKQRQKKKALVGVGPPGPRSFQQQTATGDLKSRCVFVGGNTEYRVRSSLPGSFAAARAPFDPRNYSQESIHECLRVAHAICR